jgi:hypothetical protein
VRRLQFKRVASANPNHSFIRTDHLREHASTYDTRAHGEHTRETQQRLRYMDAESDMSRVCTERGEQSESSPLSLSVVAVGAACTYVQSDTVLVGAAPVPQRFRHQTHLRHRPRHSLRPIPYPFVGCSQNNQPNCKFNSNSTELFNIINQMQSCCAGHSHYLTGFS